MPAKQATKNTISVRMVGEHGEQLDVERDFFDEGPRFTPEQFVQFAASECRAERHFNSATGQHTRTWHACRRFGISIGDSGYPVYESEKLTNKQRIGSLEDVVVRIANARHQCCPNYRAYWESALKRANLPLSLLPPLEAVTA